ncbi:Cif family virulence factor [Terriglobus tenax]|uniref:hypothetical protein n=1 Tax=Terriglobus tenax TaxID=1111115 RepID=UPI0021E0E25C|nr:hypothetical protein [Terriglobus tenax]
MNPKFAVAAIFAVGVLSSHCIGQTAATCQTRIPATWTGDVKAAAETDCAFNDDSQKTGAEAWYKFADERFATKASPSREALRDALKPNYAQPGFRVVWWPTSAQQFGTLVITSGTAEWHQPDSQGKDTIKTTHYLTVWRQQKDGSWRFIWDGGAD